MYFVKILLVIVCRFDKEIKDFIYLI